VLFSVFRLFFSAFMSWSFIHFRTAETCASFGGRLPRGVRDESAAYRRRNFAESTPIDSSTRLTFDSERSRPFPPFEFDLATTICSSVSRRDPPGLSDTSLRGLCQCSRLQLRVVSEDSLLVERDAPLRC